MAELKCPHCGSKYVIKKGTTETVGKSTDSYFCQSCKRNFSISNQTEQASGTWLMTFKNGERGSFSEGFIEVYKTADGEISINQKKEGKVSSRKQTIQLKVIANQYISDPNRKYSIQVSTYKTPNDPQGTLFFVKEIIMNKELASQAQKNEAMKAAWKGNDTYDIGQFKSQQILTDICAYLVPVVGATSGGGCYVATAVYGSYDCPQVWTLRRFRDYTLAETWYGRAFIRTYYAISPTLVKWFGKAQWFKKMWKGTLDRMVRNLNENGVKDTPYEDRNW